MSSKSFDQIIVMIACVQMSGSVKESLNVNALATSAIRKVVLDKDDDLLEFNYESLETNHRCEF